jgi:tetratricopeptide (TPR) repeat protein
MGSAFIVLAFRNHASPAELAAETRLALKNRQWSRAEELLARLARRRSPTAGDIALRAELDLGCGRADEAVRLLSGITESDSSAARTRLVAGQIEMSRDRARPAEALFLEALRLDPKLAPARRELIFLYAMQARRTDLNAQFRALSDQEPLTFDDVFLWTNSLEDRWVNDLIRPHLARFVAADSQDRMSLLALAAVVLRAGNFDECQTLLQSLPDSDDDARVLSARLALSRLQVDAARALAAGGSVEHLGLALFRGQLAVRSNDSASAVRQFRLALRLDPANREALQGLALVLKQMGDSEAAAPIQKQAEQWRHLTGLLQKSKTFEIREDKALLTQLAEACEALKQRELARAWYRLALGRNPLDQDLQRALYRLREGDRSVHQG